MKSIYAAVVAVIINLCCAITYVAAQPVASFIPVFSSPLCNPATVSFINNSSGEGELSYNWQSGIETEADTSGSPIFVYDTCGVFEVILTVTDTLGLSAADTQQIQIYCAPQASFSFVPTFVCDTSTVLFIDESQPKDSIVAWLWNFGDPVSGELDTSDLINPSHYYDEAGVYAITLTISSIQGCKASFPDTLILFDPQVDFGLIDSACVNDSALFADLSTSQDSIIAWSWNFDDPTSGANVSIKKNPIHIYKVAGDYNVRLTITTENGCTQSLKKSIHVYGLPVVSAGTDVTVCTGDSIQLAVQGALQYVWKPSDFVSDSVAQDPFVFPLSTTDFIVTGIDSNGCKASDTIIVIVAPLPATDAGSDTSLCAGTSVTLHASGGIFYLWSPSVYLDNDTLQQPIATPPVSTTFFLTATDALGCSATDSMIATVVPTPEVSITDFETSYCTNSNDVLLTATPAGGFFAGDGVLDSLFQPGSLISGGPYTVIYYYIDSIGCAGSDTASTTIYSPAAIAVSTMDSILCSNALPISFELLPVGGILAGNGISDGLFDPSIAGPGNHEIYYTLTDSNSCLSTDSLQLTVNPLPLINAGIDTSICAGDSVQLLAHGGESYSWFPGSTLTDSLVNNPLAFPPVSTQYTVTANDTNQCMNSDSVWVFILDALAADAGLNDTICYGDTTNLLATGGDKYSWLPIDGLSASNISDPLAFPLVTTMYTVTVNPDSDCPGVDSVLIIVNANPIIEVMSDTALCDGDSLQLQAAGATSYVWEPGTFLSNPLISNPIAFPSATINYVVTGTADNGCSATSSITLIVNELPPVDAGPDSSICTGDTIQLTGSGAVDYLWSPEAFLSQADAVMPLAFPDSTITFYLTGTAASGCFNTDSVQILVISAELVDAGMDTFICIGDSITLNATGGAQYSWSPTSSLSDPLIASPVAFPAVTTIYTVTAGIALNCSFTDTIVLQVNALPVVDAGTDTLICLNDTLQLNASGANNFSWSPSTYLTDPTISNPYASPAQTTTYIVTGTDLAGCINTDTITINVLPLPFASAGSDTAICTGDSVLLQAGGGSNYLWQPTGSLSDSVISNPVAKPTVTTIYIVKVTDDSGCYDYDSVTIATYPLPIANAGEDQFVCLGDTIKLQATGGVQFLWVPATSLSSATVDNPVATISGSITYTVYVTDENQCTGSDMIQLELIPPLVTMVSSDTVICTGGAALLSASGGNQYAWFPSESLDNPFTENPVATPINTTTYSVIIKDGICYSDTLQVKVFVSEPYVTAGEDAAVLAGTSFQLNATASPGLYSWTPSENLSCADCLNPIAKPLITTTYTVSVTDSSGCTASDEITLSVSCTIDALYVPNAFTPDNNGHNDVLFVRSNGIIDITYFRIFDRWGKMLFESDEIESGWDGTFKGAAMPAGVYLYTLQASCGSNNPILKQGNVTLLR
ncbi:MAG: PKD domain-containing protein [Chitinophagaceae bacterium]|nr:PKD domain-containing protein [Chitinophagaceae bacterium]